MRHVAALAALLALAAPASASGQKPSISTVLTRTTISVRGLHFVPRERVVVRVVGRTVVTRRTTATARGSFRLTLPLPKPRVCRLIIVRATGSHGDWAIQRISATECNPPGADGSSSP